jgi:hypothetical protein
VEYHTVLIGLAKLTGTVANDDVVDFGLMTVLLEEAFDGIIDKLAIEVVAYQIDGAASEAATHDA